MSSRPPALFTKIFLDSGNPEDTKEALATLGFLDGQTTNPSLVAKHPALQEKIAAGQILSSVEVNDFYKQVIQEIAALIPTGSVSIEVYADKETSAEQMLVQARAMNNWIPQAHIKFPTTAAGLAAATQAVAEQIRVNMTLVFSVEQAAAVYAATRGATRGSVFVSPFVGRLDDIGINGMGLIQQCMNLYATSDHHVEVLVASVRNMEHFLYSLALQADIITAPLSLLKEWAAAGMPVPDASFSYDPKGKEAPSSPVINLTAPLTSLTIHHPLTDKGLEKFVADWNSLIGN